MIAMRMRIRLTGVVLTGGGDYEDGRPRAHWNCGNAWGRGRQHARFLYGGHTHNTVRVAMRMATLAPWHWRRG